MGGLEAWPGLHSSEAAVEERLKACSRLALLFYGSLEQKHINAAQIQTEKPY